MNPIRAQFKYRSDSEVNVHVLHYYLESYRTCIILSRYFAYYLNYIGRSVENHIQQLRVTLITNATVEHL